MSSPNVENSNGTLSKASNAERITQLLDQRGFACVKALKLGGGTLALSIICMTGLTLAVFGKSLNFSWSVRLVIYIGGGSFGALAIVTAYGTYHFFCLTKKENANLQNAFIEALIEEAENRCINRKEHPDAQQKFNHWFIMIDEDRIPELFETLANKEGHQQGRLAFAFAHSLEDTQCCKRMVANLMCVPRELMRKICLHLKGNEFHQLILEKLKVLNATDETNFFQTVPQYFGRNCADGKWNKVFLYGNLTDITFAKAAESSDNPELKKEFDTFAKKLGFQVL